MDTVTEKLEMVRRRFNTALTGKIISTSSPLTITPCGIRALLSVVGGGFRNHARASLGKLN